MVEMEACGLCGTDLEKMKGEYTSAMPVLGHEAVGTVKEAGEGATFRAGDRVFPHHHVACKGCYYCRRGDETICPDYKTSNISPGGFSELIRVPRWNVSKGGVARLPASMSFEEGALIEPLACCIRALDRCDVRPDDSVLVAGAGPVGMMHALLLKAAGARVMVSDVAKPRLELAARLSGAAVFDASSRELPGAVRAETAGRGADLAVVASGSARAVAQALKSVRRGGRLCLFGIPAAGGRLEEDLSAFYDSTVTVMSSYGADDADVAKAVDAIERRAQEFRPLVTHRFPLARFDEAVRTMASGEGLKVLVTG